MKMKLTKIYLILLYQSVELLINTKSDHVQVIGCAKEPQCLTNLNRHLLQIIQENLETTAQPCENFWTYACGSWTSAPYHDHVDNFGAMANYYADNLIETLTALNTHDFELTKLVQQLLKYFQACKTLKVMNLTYAQYLKELPLEKIFGESFRWHHLFREDSWREFDWLQAAAFLRRYGFKDSFVQETAGFARQNAQQYVVQLKIPRAEISFHNKYQVLQIMETFDLISSLNRPKNYLRLADEVVEFDNRLQLLYKTHKNVNENHRLLLHDLPFLLGPIDWHLYFAVMLSQQLPAETVVEFAGNFNCFKDLNSLLKQTTKSVQGSYTLLKFCQYLMDIRPTITDRDCMLHTNVMFPVGVNYIYNRFLYKTRLVDERMLQFIFSRLKNEFDEIIKENKFHLDFVQMQQLREKLKLMRLKIGNLPSALNDTAINLYYARVRLKESNFYNNHLEMLKFRNWQQHQPLFDALASPADLDNFYVNDDIAQLRSAPYFVHKRNMIIIPMVFLQLPFYHHAQHPVLQFSLMGWILAHELSHAFDSHGLDFDEWGNKKLSGNKSTTKTSFNSVLQCLVAYSPTVSLNERMADVNGLQLAFQTFFHHVPRNAETWTLQQLFFINFAQFFCGSLPRAIGHDRDDVRVRQSIANMKEFSETFQCSATAKENPQRKCSIWRK